MSRVLHGVVRGRFIELDADAGLEDGRKVEVVVRTKILPGLPPGWRPGSTESAAGMMAECWTAEDDRILNEIHQERKRDGQREIPDLEDLIDIPDNAFDELGDELFLSLDKEEADREHVEKSH